MKWLKEQFKSGWNRIVLVIAILTICAFLNADALRVSVNRPVSEPIASTSVPTHNDRRICINVDMMGDDWPIPEAAEQWNKNGKNIFVLVSSRDVKNERCNGFVIIHSEDTGAYWGVTQHTGTSTVRLAVSSRIPLDKRLHVLCHELGHVLGLPHFETPGDSCMNLGIGALQLYHPAPTSQDLQGVGRDLWDWDKARQSASR